MSEAGLVREGGRAGRLRREKCVARFFGAATRWLLVQCRPWFVAHWLRAGGAVREQSSCTWRGCAAVDPALKAAVRVRACKLECRLCGASLHRRRFVDFRWRTRQMLREFISRVRVAQLAPRRLQRGQLQDTAETRAQTHARRTATKSVKTGTTRHAERQCRKSHRKAQGGGRTLTRRRDTRAGPAAIAPKSRGQSATRCAS